MDLDPWYKAQDIANYNTSKIQKFISADKNLLEGIASGNELMINAAAGLYIDPRIYGEIRSALTQE